MPNDKQVIDRISTLKGQVEAAGKELARHEAQSEQAETRVTEIETALKDNGFDPSKDLTPQLAKASAEVEGEMAAIQTELEALR